jgi:hypothetical protein
VQHALPIDLVQEGHDDALHGPPPDPDDDDDDPEPPEELEPPLPPAAHAPPLHVWPDAHVLQDSPPEPHAVGSVPPWQAFVVSQQPAQVAPEHPPASSPVTGPLSSSVLIGPLSSAPPLDPLLLLVLP